MSVAFSASHVQALKQAIVLLVEDEVENPNSPLSFAPTGESTFEYFGNIGGIVGSLQCSDMTATLAAGWNS
ncbi:unnamed protein product [Clonostachys rosea]|uniref:Uncharacterized protein n=1 Tax=Bionectria ochroleuca TaxID=29856 RepID=A0ABY6U7V0_BIOOC|nr:unnamed protein product [Clonostachys rosea]